MILNPLPGSSPAFAASEDAVENGLHLRDATSSAPTGGAEGDGTTPCRAWPHGASGIRGDHLASTGFNDPLAACAEELDRLKHGLTTRAHPTRGRLVRYIVRCPTGAPLVESLATSVLRTLDAAALGGSLRSKSSTARLPSWFVEACKTDETEWRQHPERPRARCTAGNTSRPDAMAGRWRLDDWLAAMEPARRTWFWWEARISRSLEEFLLAVEAHENLGHAGTLCWLCRAAGAASTEPLGQAC